MNKWSIADARQRFAELLRGAEKEPQPILNRGRLVAAVVDARTFAEFEAWRSERSHQTVGDAFRELRKIRKEERYPLKTGARRNRANTFVDLLDEVSG